MPDVDTPIISKKCFKVVFQKVITIHAPEEEVWDAINDPAELKEWFNMIVEIEGAVEKNGWIGVRYLVNPGRVIKYKVTSYEPFELLVLKRGVNPFFTNTQEFRMRYQEGLTTLKLRETYAGLTIPFSLSTLVDAQNIFMNYAEDLKKKFENESK